MTPDELHKIAASVSEGRPYGHPDYEIARLRRHVRTLARELESAWQLLDSERQALALSRQEVREAGLTRSLGLPPTTPPSEPSD